MFTKNVRFAIIKSHVFFGILVIKGNIYYEVR